MIRALPLMLLLAPSTALAVTVELNPGDDIASLTETLAAGDEFVFNDGVYQLGGQVSWSGQGTAAAPIVFRAADGANPVLELTKGEDGDYDGNLLYISDSTFLEIRGIDLRGDDSWADPDDRFIGLQMNNVSDVTLSDVSVTRTGNTGLYLNGTNARLTFEDVEVGDVLDGTGIWIGCNDASCWTSESTFTRLLVHDVGGQYTGGIVLAHGSQGITIEDAVVYGIEHRGVYFGSTEYGDPNVLFGSAIWATGGEGLRVEGAARIRNNLIFNVGEQGIRSEDPDRGTWGDVVISYNTVADTSEWAADLDDWADGSGMVLSSNALCNPVGYGVQFSLPDTGDTGLPEHGAYVTDNVVCGLSEGPDPFEGEIIAGGGWADFSDAAGWDFYPVDGAVLVDAGDPSSEAWIPDEDFNGLPREGDAPDVGAYEWSGDGNPGWAVQEDFKEDAQPPGPSEETVGGCGCGKDKGADTGAALLLALPLGVLGLRRRRR